MARYCNPVAFLYDQLHSQRLRLRLHTLMDVLTKQCPQIQIVGEVAVKQLPDLRVEIKQEDVEKLQLAEILIADPLVLGELGHLSFPKLKWVHSTWAGVNALTRNIRSDKSVEHPPYILTRNGTSFVKSMAHYVLMYILAHERHVVKTFQNQQSRIWQKLPYREMDALTLGILGLGEIGKATAKLAKALDMKVWGLVRTLPAPDAKCPEVDEYRTTEDLSELLSSCDYVCSVLPSTTATDGLLDGNILSSCQNKKSVFMNIGRGNVVKNGTILKALEQGWVSHVILDVFEKEPLQTDSELWNHPQVIVTPHVAGIGFIIEEFVSEFLANYERYRNSEPMKFVVDWSAEY